MLSFDNKYNNVVYIQPSQWTVDVWKNDFKYDIIPVVPYAFCIDIYTYIFKECPKTKIFVYTKQRDKNEIKYVLSILKSKNIDYTIINYGNYCEDDYIKLLEYSKYGIWIGCHESQGFALLCALSCGVPLLVWNVRKMSQEINCPTSYYNINTQASSIPYWDKRCGEYFC